MSLAAGVLAATAIFALLAFLLNRLTRERALATLAFAIAAGLLLLRQVALAVPVALFAYGLWRRGAPIPGPARGQSSEARSAALAMSLDHDSGEMDGEVLKGPFVGRRLSGLSLAEINALMTAFEATADTDSLALLLAYLERRRDAPGPETDPPPPDAGALTDADAYRVLGLAPGASVEDVRAAYRRLIRRVHPDLGGTSALAALLNAAKERLDPDVPRSN